MKMMILGFFNKLLGRFLGSTYWKDITWLMSGAIVAQALTFASMPVFSRLFSPADFAVQNLFNQVVSFTVVLATLRYECLIQLPNRYRDAVGLQHLVALMGISASILLTPIAWYFRETLAGWAGDTALSPWVIFAPVAAFAISLGIAIQGGAQRRGHFRLSSESDVLGKLFYVVTILLGFIILPGAGGLVLAGLFGSCFKIVWLLKGAQRIKFGILINYLQLARKYFRLSGSLVFSHILLASTVAIPTFFIANNYGADALGQFAIAYQVVMLPSTLLAGAIGNVYYQRASERRTKGLPFDDIWRSTVHKLLLLGIPFYVGAIFIMPWFVPFLFGDTWQPAGLYAAILSFGAFFSFVTSPLDRACLVVGAWWYVPLWHSARVATTGLVTILAFKLQWNMEAFLTGLTIQQATLYLIDFAVEWKFARIQPMERLLVKGAE